MEQDLVRRYQFNRGELRVRLIRCLADDGIEIRGETRLIFDNGGVTLEEFASPDVSSAKGQVELELKK